MLKSLTIAFFLFSLFPVAVAASEDRVVALPLAARSWVPGQPVPDILLQYRHDPSDEGWAGPYDSQVILAELHNLPLLIAIILHPAADERVAKQALNVALYEDGPSKTFALLRDDLPKASHALKNSRVDSLRKRASTRHVVVDGVFIHSASAADEQTILNGIESALRNGKQWNDVLELYRSKYPCPDAKTTSPCLCIGNLGHFIIFVQPRRWWFGSRVEFSGDAALSDKMGKKLYAQRAGEIIRGVEKEEGPVLFQVREVYEPN